MYRSPDALIPAATIISYHLDVVAKASICNFYLYALLSYSHEENINGALNSRSVLDKNMKVVLCYEWTQIIEMNNGNAFGEVYQFLSL